MNELDVALVVLLLLCALRGFWRGFFRESLGFAGLILALAAALRFCDAGAEFLAARVPAAAQLPPPGRVGVSFVVIFVIVQGTLNLLGLLLDRIVGSRAMYRASRIGGALFGAAKAGAVLAFVLLFLHVFPVVPRIEQRIVESRLAHSLVSIAGSVVRAGLAGGAQPGGRA